MTHSIDHNTLKKAAEQLRIICAGGYREQLEREYWERVHELPRRGFADPLHEMHLQWDAKLLAVLTGAPLSQCSDVLRDAGGELRERVIGLDLLANMSRDVQRLQAQTARMCFGGRRAG